MSQIWRYLMHSSWMQMNYDFQKHVLIITLMHFVQEWYAAELCGVTAQDHGHSHPLHDPIPAEHSHPGMPSSLPNVIRGPQNLHCKVLCSSTMVVQLSHVVRMLQSPTFGHNSNPQRQVQDIVISVLANQNLMENTLFLLLLLLSLLFFQENLQPTFFFTEDKSLQNPAVIVCCKGLQGFRTTSCLHIVVSEYAVKSLYNRVAGTIKRLGSMLNSWPQLCFHELSV